MNSAASQSSNSRCVGRNALGAQVVERRGQSPAKRQSPEAIHEDAGHQRIVSRDHPLGQVEPRRARRVARVELFQKAGNAGRDNLARSHPANCRAAKPAPSRGSTAMATRVLGILSSTLLLLLFDLGELLADRVEQRRDAAVISGKLGLLGLVHLIRGNA